MRARRAGPSRPRAMDEQTAPQDMISNKGIIIRMITQAYEHCHCLNQRMSVQVMSQGFGAPSRFLGWIALFLLC